MFRASKRRAYERASPRDPRRAGLLRRPPDERARKGFYASLQSMVKTPRFSSGIEEFSIFPSAYLTEKELNAYLAGTGRWSNPSYRREKRFSSTARISFTSILPP